MSHYLAARGVDPSMMKRHLAMLSGNEVSDDYGCPTDDQILRCDFKMANPNTAQPVTRTPVWLRELTDVGALKNPHPLHASG